MFRRCLIGVPKVNGLIVVAQSKGNLLLVFLEQEFGQDIRAGARLGGGARG